MKRVCIGLMVLALALRFAGTPVAAAAKYQNLMGTWSGTANVAWVNGAASNFENVGVTMEITNQDANGMFYGSFTYGLGSAQPITGSISTNKVITACEYMGIGAYQLFNCKLAGNKITGTFITFSGTYINTSSMQLIKQ